MNKTLNECQTHWNKHKSSHGKSSFSLFIFFLFFPSCHSSSSILPPYWYFVSCLALFSLGCHHSLSCRFYYFAPWIFSSFFSFSLCVCVYCFDSICLTLHTSQLFRFEAQQKFLLCIFRPCVFFSPRQWEKKIAYHKSLRNFSSIRLMHTHTHTKIMRLYCLFLLIFQLDFVKMKRIFCRHALRFHSWSVFVFWIFRAFRLVCCHHFSFIFYKRNLF